MKYFVLKVQLYCLKVSYNKSYNLLQFITFYSDPVVPHNGNGHQGLSAAGAGRERRPVGVHQWTRSRSRRRGQATVLPAGGRNGVLS